MAYVLQASITFAGFEVVDPAKLHKYPLISRAYQGKANSFRCPTGRAYGQGWVLLYGSYLDSLSETVPNDLVFQLTNIGNDLQPSDEIQYADDRTLQARRKELQSDDKQPATPTPQVTLRNLFFHRAICLTPGPTPSESVFLCEVVDPRFIFERFSSLTKTYNLRSPTSVKKVARTSNTNTLIKTDCYVDSLKEDVGESDGYRLWDWLEVLQDVWDTFATTYHLSTSSLTEDYDTPANSDFPLVRPRDLAYFGVSAYGVFCELLDRLNLVLVFDPTVEDSSDTPSFKLVKLPIDEDDTDGDAQEWTGDRYNRAFDYNIVENESLKFPAKFKVHFRCAMKHPGTEPDVDRATGENYCWLPNVVEVREVTTVNVTGWEGVTPSPSTVEALWSDHVALRLPDGTFDNDSLLDDWAEELVKIVLSRRNPSKSGKVIYNGLYETLTPGNVLQTVVWRDYGDGIGICTEIQSQETTPTTLPNATESVLPGGANSILSSQKNGWSAALGFGGLFGSMYQGEGLGSTIRPPLFGNLSHREFSRNIQLVMVCPHSGIDNDTYEDFITDNFGVGNDPDGFITAADGRIAGKVVLLNPENTPPYPFSTEWITDNADTPFFGPDCWIVAPGLKYALADSPFTLVVGQMLLARQQGVASDGKPIFLINFQHTFITGVLNGCLQDDGTATAIGYDTKEYTVNGFFLPAGTYLPASTVVGFIATPLGNGPSYWTVIVSKSCPVSGTCPA